MTPERFNKIVAVLNRRQPDLTVVTDYVHKGQNLSAIIRTCDAVGIQEVHSVYQEGGFGAHTGTTMGSHKWVHTHIYRNISEPLLNLKNDNYQIIAADLSESTVDYRSVDYTRPTALLLGAEKYGISETAGNYVDQRITVPMLGMVESFNVSVACAIVLAEVRSQREKAGFYEQRRLLKSDYDKLLFEWLHPLLARYCEKHQLPYPELDEKGGVIDPGWRERI